jgi:hypothetical protein
MRLVVSFVGFALVVFAIGGCNPVRTPPAPVTFLIKGWGE